jgi:asparaginyl-tRNA synthetase
MKLSLLFKQAESLIDCPISTWGWVKNISKHKEVWIININDGSTMKGLQLIYDVSGNSQEHITVDTSIKVAGTLVKSPKAGQPVELLVSRLEIMGKCDPETYPLSKGKLPIDYLRPYHHLRQRRQTYAAVSRIRSAASQATHLFMKQMEFLHVDPNSLTTNECEGGAGVFQVTENDISKPQLLKRTKNTITDISGNKQTTTSDNYDWTSDHFGQPVYLTVSAQLQLEAAACALGDVYTIQPSYRAEHSNTAKHASCFMHLEIESCHFDLHDLITFGEDYIKFVIKYILSECKEEVAVLNEYVSKGLLNRLERLASSDFNRIPYEEAIKIAILKGKFIKYGEDLSSEVENCLTEHFNGPVSVYNWPIAIKSFYMKQDLINPTLCNNFDMLMPYKVGELIGGSMREDDCEKLQTMMKTKNIDGKSLEFFTDLRRYGTVPHGGFGLGFDRFVMLLTGMENIRDVIAFPATYKCPPL